MGNTNTFLLCYYLLHSYKKQSCSAVHTVEEDKAKNMLETEYEQIKKKKKIQLSAPARIVSRLYKKL